MIGPDNTPLRFLSCGRIILEGDEKASARSEGREVALICIKGAGEVRVDSSAYAMTLYDALYIPPGKQYDVAAKGRVDLVECSAPSEKAVETQFVPFEKARHDPALHLTVGDKSSTREVYKLIDDNVEAARLVCGLTFGKPGHWTSWSPHEHGTTREEVYLYIDMPKPNFGLQMIYSDLQNVDFVAPVFEDDAVVITEGYHPNVGIPGCGINFVWMMAGLRPDVDREWADMHFQPEFVGKG